MQRYEPHLMECCPFVVFSTYWSARHIAGAVSTYWLLSQYIGGVSAYWCCLNIMALSQHICLSILALSQHIGVVTTYWRCFNILAWFQHIGVVSTYWYLSHHIGVASTYLSLHFDVCFVMLVFLWLPPVRRLGFGWVVVLVSPGFALLPPSLLSLACFGSFPPCSLLRPALPRLGAAGIASSRKKCLRHL